MTDKSSFAAPAYLALWNETDAERRRVTIATLFAPGVALFSPNRETHGFAELEQRVVASYEKWVRDAGCRFELRGAPDGHHHIVRLRWRMVKAGDGAPISIGTDVLVLDGEGRIAADYQFIDPD